MGKAEKTDKSTKKQKHFWKDFKAELKKVIWPTRSQVVNNTIIVLIIVIIVTAIVFVLDLAFEALNTYGIDKLKTFVQNTIVSEDGNKTNDTEENNNENDNTNNTETDENNNAENTETPDDTANVENIENVSE